MGTRPYGTWSASGENAGGPNVAGYSGFAPYVIPPGRASAALPGPVPGKLRPLDVDPAFRAMGYGSGGSGVAANEGPGQHQVRTPQGPSRPDGTQDIPSPPRGDLPSGPGGGFGTGDVAGPGGLGGGLGGAGAAEAGAAAGEAAELAELAVLAV